MYFLCLSLTEVNAEKLQGVALIEATESSASGSTAMKSKQDDDEEHHEPSPKKIA